MVLCQNDTKNAEALYTIPISREKTSFQIIVQNLCLQLLKETSVFLVFELQPIFLILGYNCVSSLKYSCVSSLNFKHCCSTKRNPPLPIYQLRANASISTTIWLAANIIPHAMLLPREGSSLLPKSQLKDKQSQYKELWWSLTGTVRTWLLLVHFHRAMKVREFFQLSNFHSYFAAPLEDHTNILMYNGIIINQFIIWVVLATIFGYNSSKFTQENKAILLPNCWFHSLMYKFLANSKFHTITNTLLQTHFKIVIGNTWENQPKHI